MSMIKLVNGLQRESLEERDKWLCAAIQGPESQQPTPLRPEVTTALYHFNGPTVDSTINDCG